MVTGCALHSSFVLPNLSKTESEGEGLIDFDAGSDRSTSFYIEMSKKKRSIFKLVDVLESQVKSNRLNLLSKWEYFQLVGAHLLPTTIEKLIETSLKSMFTIFTVHHIMTSSNNRKDSFWNSFTIAGWTQFTSSCNSAVVIPCSLLTCNSSPVPVPSGWNPPPPPPPPFDSVSELNLQHWIFGT